MKTLTKTLIMVLFLVGCQDNAAPIAPVENPRADMMIPLEDAMVTPDMASRVKPPPIIANLRMEISPWRTQFRTSDTAQLRVLVERDDDSDIDVTNQSLVRIEPAGIAAIDSQSILSFRSSGSGVITACYSNLCDQRHFIVNEGPPVLVVTEPTFGAALDAENGEGIRVVGKATDDGDTIIVRVNDHIVELDDEGNFETIIDAEFGMNSIVVSADDGLSLRRSRVVRDVLWARVYAPSRVDGLTLDSPAAIRVDQRLFDSNETFEVPDLASRVTVEGVAEFIEMLLTIIDVNQLIDPSSLFGSGGPDLEITGFDLGVPAVDFEITPTGLDLFLTMSNGRIETTGALDFQGQSLSLSGFLELGLSARVGLDVTLDGGLTSSISGVDVALEYLTPNYESQAVNAILELAKPEIRALVELEFGEVLGSLLGQLVTSFVDEGIGSLFTGLQNIPVDLTTGIGPDAGLGLTMSLIPTALELSARRMMVMGLDFSITHDAIEAEAHPIQGCPVFSSQPWTEIPSQGVGLSLRPAVLNCVLYSAWRQGLLNFPVPLPAELAFVVSEVTIDAFLPPLFRPSPQPNGFPYELQFGSLVVDVKRMGSEAFDRYSISVRAGMSIDIRGGSLSVILAELPQVRATLETAGSDNPLPNSLLEQTIVNLVWEDMKNALLSGLGLALGEVSFEAGEISALAPRVNQLTVNPTFDQNVIFLEDRLSFEGFLQLSADLSAATP